MRNHDPLETKEFFNLCIFKLFRLMDFTPDFGYVLHENSLIFFSIVSSIIEISKYKYKIFRWLLTKKFQVAFENYFQEAVVTGSISSDIVHPHINHQDVSNSKCKKRCSLFKGHSLFSSFFRIGSFDIVNQSGAIFTSRHPDTLCRLLTTFVLVHGFKFSFEK